MCLRLIRATGLALLVTLSTSACTLLAPAYNPSIQSAQKLKDGQVSTAKVGTFSAEGSAVNNVLQMRANKMVAPRGSYAQYLADALTQELQLAKAFDANSEIEISGALLKNEVDASGIITGIGEMEARFVVKRGGVVRFDKAKKTLRKWDSSFAAAVAIPKAQQEYAFLVQQLIAELFADADFVAALKF